MISDRQRVCPVERAGNLDSRFRRWVQNPHKILKPYVKEGMIVLDIGCGPGFFSLELARLVGESGRVIASDLQEGMLQKLRDKVKGTEFEKRITLHTSQKDRIGLSDKVDFALAFYVVHETPDQKEFFNEIKSILKTNGKVFIVEPPVHVSRKAFNKTLGIAREAGFIFVESPKVFLSKTAILKKS